MKRFLWLLAALLALTLAIPAAAQTSGDLTHGLVSCWDMEEASGTRADAWGSNDLTDNNTVGQAAGLIGSAADFVSANSEYLSIPDNPSLSPGSITIYQNFMPNSTGSVLGLSAHSTRNDISWDLRQKVRAVVRFSVSEDGTTLLKANSTVTLSAGNWYQLVAFADAGNEFGVSVNNETPITGSLSGPLHDSSNVFVIGARKTGRAPYDGRIDTTAIWSTVLTSAQRTWLYNSGSGRSCSEIIATGNTLATSGAYTVTLPSGKIGTVALSMTTGDIMVGAGLVFLSLLTMFQLIQRAVMAIRATGK